MMMEQVVEKINVRSHLLMAKSGYFRTLFTTEMTEGSQREVTIKVTATEVDPFMQLVNYINGNKWMLRGLSKEELFCLLPLTQKYDAKECMKFCCNELRRGMREEDALHSLQLQPYLQMEKEVQLLSEYAIQYLGTIQLKDETKDYFVSQYKDLEKFEEKVLGFPINIVEAIVSSNDLVVTSEDIVYNFLCKWARIHYSQRHIRRDVLGQFASRIRFRYMTFKALKRFASSPDFEPDVAQPLVVDALFFKSGIPDPEYNQQLPERVYKYRPVKVLKFKVPQPACVVYIDLPHIICKNMSPSGHVYSERFELGEHGLHLFASCHDQEGGVSSFGLFLGTSANNQITVEFEFAARVKPLRMFKVLYRRSCTLARGDKFGTPNLFNILWDSFIREDGEYFCGGVLHLRADLKLMQ